MFRSFLASLVFLGGSASLSAQTPADSPVREPLHEPIDHSRIETEIEANLERLGIDRSELDGTAARGDYDRLIYPVRARPNADLYRANFSGNFVDLDPVAPNSRMDWACGARTYDLNTGYDHAGTDISTTPFRAHAMNRRWVEVIAAAPGVIIARNDDAQDRNCGGLGADQRANYVSILQDDGLTAYYWHLARASLTDRQVGDRVETGDFLGLVGSSGISTAPHLHFELRDPDGNVVDPYAGTCGASETLWRHQHQYTDPVITAIYTHNYTPVNVSGSFCEPEYPRFRTSFDPGDTVHLGLYVRDREIGAMSSVSVRDPSGTEVFSQNFPAATVFSAAGDYQTRYTLAADAPTGQWTIRGNFQGDVRERAFYVGSEPEAGAALAAAVLPSSRSVQATQPATVFATVLNYSGVAAQGCWISPAVPFAGAFEYRETDPATNAVIGNSNALFNIAPGGARSFVISFTPHAGSVADSLDLTLRYKCDNSDAAGLLPGVNSVLLSFGPDAVPDLIAIAVTPSADGILQIADENSAAAFAAAVSNVGAEGALTVRPDGLGAASGLRLLVCETDTGSGACLADPAASVTRNFSSDSTASFAVFAFADGLAVPFDPATARIRVLAEDGGGVVRGSTSVAVRTD
ncbi:peptidoglycan DD-metalloendopeptidase family protein [Hyphobacterium sp. HN65]|uniref:Peptidoglycan DD-metalloendopeptidase family protein n=1 Tax=Hyphobacterium lacteum TaxID=3116575 RepID=A0ABU7LNC6_9PROT|nr:peptidoglycan DD-metalloendopeptidase family protein [Hyphobacterium sp. HN65]MEE2525415.1 peptidoglycan DD-metalloendopeptidase family protein [Hyphobacterium sp. HN65]